MTLHEAIIEVIKEAGKPLAKNEIANRINEGKLYTRGDGNPVPTNQISARINNYPDLFTVNSDETISLKSGV